MPLTMQTNASSLMTQHTINKSNNLLNTAMERLSTGYRINSAKDDAAGLQIANRLDLQTRGMKIAQRNAQDGNSMLQTAEGAFDEVTDILYRMNDLATQASNGTNSSDDLTALNTEFSSLRDELGNIMGNTSYAGDNLFSASGLKGGGLSLQIGASTSETLSLANNDTSISVAFNALTSGDITAQDGATVLQDSDGNDLIAMSALDLTTTAATDGSTPSGAYQAMNSISAILDTVNTARSGLGATQNRLDHSINNLDNMIENTTAAKGRITDTDFAVESSNMTKNQMLVQAGTTVLSRSNQLTSLATSLLQ